MIEKEVWTLDGRKKIFLVDGCNRVIKELKDLGPLNETERLWVRIRPGVPYNEWIKEYEKEQAKKDDEPAVDEKEEAEK
ncbi:hypothetical protein [[Eubacterium] cellulosolvens]